jgi:pimeloyl-ACP methyl ester carboxylesterase
MSSLSWETFYNTDYAGLDDAASIWKQYTSAAAEIETALIEDIPVLKEGAGDQERDDFDGETADQVRGHARRICNQFLDDVDAYAARIQALLEETKSGFEGKRDALADLFAEKNVYLTAKGGPGEEHFEVDESSLYNYLSGTGSFQPMNEFEANDYEQRVREQAVDMSDRFKSLMDEVRALDDDLAAAFKALNDDAPALPPYIGASFEAKTAEYLQELHQDMLSKIESGEATPEEVNAWWNSMPEADQVVFTNDLPELVGPVDGIPTDDRNTANRLLLEQELAGFSPTLDDDIASLEAQLEEMRANGEQYIQSGYRGPLTESTEYAALQAQLDELTSQRDSRDALSDLQTAITGTASTGQEYFLIDFDSAGDGKAIVSVGNPDSADNTAVYVPGTGTDLGSFTDEYGTLARAETMAYDAQRLGGSEETAVVAWFDYDAPNEPVPEAGDLSYAEAAGATLSQFTDGLAVTHDGSERAHTTVVGHSYGTTVVGHTASEYGVEADKIIALASPGLDTDHASELGVGAENVYVATAEGDAIRHTTDTLSWIAQAAAEGVTGGRGGVDWDAQGDGPLGWHGGTNPMHEDYGATVFASEALDKEGNETDDGTAIHSGYTAEGNIARDSIAYILTDQTDQVISPEEHQE